ncbi:P-type conjugative transfer protein TrbL [Caballeronia sp. LP003]|uniref:P-type conjugative transfer protein TrbL n=1 Tax=Caballeronia sp. LP003 TaxID=3038551 RepID=UPI002858B3BE|nr:P-type conjugative transfer protein TrbL [Caballeronia sp. LP003]MDR5791722.1 P-type conjugative transfer protein TrbL [Caballeronia sp. LP003]
MKKNNLWAIAILAMFLPQLAHASTDGGAQMHVMQDMLDMFASNGKSWISTTQEVAVKIFGTLALIEIALKMRKVVMSGGEEGPMQIMGVLFKTIMTWGFFYWAMQQPDYVLGNIIHGFEALGGKASGLGSLNPSQMIGAGLDIAGQIISGIKGWSLVTNLTAAIVTGVTVLAVILGFAILGLQMFAALLHYYLLLAAAPILLAGGALSFTRDWAIKQFQGAVSTGLKIFVIYLIAGIVTKFIPEFKAAITNGGLDNMGPLLGMLAASILILFLSFFAPSVASAIMSGTNSMSANEMAGFAATVGGAAAMAGAGAIAGGQLAGRMLGKGAEGMGALSNMAGAAGNALGHMTSGIGTMRDALSTGGPSGGSSGGAAGSSGGGGVNPAMDAAKRVGGDLPSGMTPSSAQSKALMNQPAMTPPGNAATSQTQASSGAPGSGGQSASPSAPDAASGAGSGDAGTSAQVGQADSGGGPEGQAQGGAASSASSAAQTPAGDARDAAISGQQGASGAADADKVSRSQQARDLFSKTQQNMERVKGFIPDAHNSGTLHINMQD